LLTLPGLYLLAVGINAVTGGEAPPLDAFREDQRLIPVFSGIVAMGLPARRLMAVHVLPGS